MSGGDASVVFHIRLVRKGRVLREWAHPGAEVTVGAGEDCDVHVRGNTGLRERHVTLAWEDGEIEVVAHDGAEVSVNGEPVDVGFMGPEDQLTLGRLTFTVETKPAPAPVPKPAPAPAPVPKPAKTLPPPGNTPLEFRVRMPTGKAARVPVRDNFTAGSGRANLKLPYDGVADRHARFTRTGDKVLVRALGEATLTVDGRSVRKVLLALDELVALGTVTLQLRLPKNAKPKPTEPVRSPRTTPTSRADVPAVAVSVPDGPPIAALPTMPPDEDIEAPDHTAPTGEAVLDDAVRRVAESLLERTAPPTLPPDDIEDPGADEGPPSPVADAPSDAAGEPAATEEPPAAAEDEPAPFFEEDEDEVFPDFDLASLLLTPAESVKTEGPTESSLVARIARVRDGRVVEMVEVRDSYSSPTGELRLAVTADQVALTRQATVLGEAAASLPAGSTTTLHGADGDYRIDVFRPSTAAKGWSVSLSPMLLPVLLVAAMLHVGLGVAAAAIDLRELDLAEEAEEEEVFATIEMAKKPEKKKVEPPKPDVTKMAEKAPKVTAKRVAQAAKAPVSNAPPKKVSDVLERLSRVAKTTEATTDGITNIKAVAKAPGSASSFDVAGRLAALPGNDVKVARTGSGAVTTAVDAKATKAAATLKPAAGGKVRGTVTKVSSQVRVQGQLSREQISSVVNKNIRKVQACYEKELIKNPGLTGRVVFEWVVTESGAVSNVRVRSSSLAGTAVPTCISSLIKRWTFPKPEGGPVTVTYPFLFRSAAM